MNFRRHTVCQNSAGPTSLYAFLRHLPGRIFEPACKGGGQGGWSEGPTTCAAHDPKIMGLALGSLAGKTMNGAVA